MNTDEVNLDFISATRFGLEAFGLEKIVEVLTRHPGDVDGLQDLSALVGKHQLGRFSRHFDKFGVFVLFLEILEDEGPHLGKSIQPSSAAGLDDAVCDDGVLALGQIFGLCHGYGNHQESDNQPHFGDSEATLTVFSFVFEF